jgi:hypothetical protein
MHVSSCSSILFATLFAELWANLQRHQNLCDTYVGSAVIAFVIFRMLIHLGAAYSESISVLVDSVHEFPRHSNPNFEVKVLNDSAFNSTIDRSVVNHGPFRLSRFWTVKHLVISAIMPIYSLISSLAM